MTVIRRSLLFALWIGLLVVRPAHASFHLMQIEQVIGGVNGDVSAQAIQLRMRVGFQNLVQLARLIVRDATGSNPVTVIDISAPVVNGGTGVWVLIASPGFSAYTSPALTPDFTMTNLIPASYLAAGSLTWEDDFGTVYWRLSWGGASYTGSGTASITNDADGNFNPPFAGPLPSTSLQALQFKFAATALSTNNANDYQLTAGAAVFTNNVGGSGTLMTPLGVGDDLLTAGVVMLGPPYPNPVSGALTYSVSLPRAARVQVRVFDLRGRLVRSLVDRPLEPGRHSFSWDAAGDAGVRLSSGTYWLRLDADGVQRSRKFTVIR